MRGPVRPRRSCHVVPGSNQRMLSRAATINADVVILDLEDSVAEAQKSAARTLVANTLLDWHPAAPTTALRINAVTTPHWHRDLIDLFSAAGVRIDVVVLPMVEVVSQLTTLCDVLCALEGELGLEPGRVGIEAQIETARGLVNVEAIAAAPRLEALVFGPGDFAASVGMSAQSIGAPLRNYPGDGWHYALSKIAVTAKAFGLAAIDGPFADFGDLEGLEQAAFRSRALGFDGKWSIHPSQVDVLNATYSPSAEELTWATGIVDACAAAEARGFGAASHGGAMIDEASRKMAEGLVARAFPRR